MTEELDCVVDAPTDEALALRTLFVVAWAVDAATDEAAADRVIDDVA